MDAGYGRKIQILFNYVKKKLRVLTYLNGQIGAGTHQMVWDAGEMPSGVYFMQMTTGDFQQVRKVVLLK